MRMIRKELIEKFMESIEYSEDKIKLFSERNNDQMVSFYEGTKCEAEYLLKLYKIYHKDENENEQ